MRQSIFVVLVLTISLYLISTQCAAQSQIQPGYDSLKIVEKVYLHTDRDIYNPGDDIWFKAYLIEASERLLTDNSGNLHVELISPSAGIIDSRILRMDNGLGKGDFHLSDKLYPGRYILRAYTNYMRNFGEELFFKRKISVVNTLNIGKSLSPEDETFPMRPDLQFFPESGSLADNILSVVAFKATGTDGYSIDVEGEIYSSDNEKVADFKSTHNGMGSFFLKPLSGKNYYAQLKTRNGEIIRYDLPGSYSTGIVMSLSRNLKDELSLTFNTSPEALPLYLNKDFSLTVSARNIPLETYSIRIKTLKNYLNLPTVNLPEGILMLTLSGGDNLPLCERLVYNEKNTSNGGINITISKKVFKQRDSVCVKISSTGNPGTQSKLFLSFSAANELFTDDPASYSSTISSWFLLESDVRGPVEKPSYYFDNSNPDRLKDLDLLLLTQGWRDFSWKYDEVKYPSEHGFTISGRAKKKFTDAGIVNSSVTLSIFQDSIPHIINVPTDTTGRFNINGLELSGEAKLIASISDSKDNLKGQLILDSVKYTPATFKEKIIQRKSEGKDKVALSYDQSIAADLLDKKNIPTFIQYSEYISSMQKKYKLSDTITPGEVRITAFKQDAPGSPRARSLHYLMGTPEHELVITPDIRKIYHNTFQLIEFKYINPIKLPWYFISAKIRWPLYMIDGVVVEAAEVKSLPLELVERIDVMDKLASYLALRKMVKVNDTASVWCDGVISIILKNYADFNNNPVLHSANIRFSGFNEPRIFYSPKHHTTLEKDYKPDLRCTLYWNPDIILEDGKDLSLDYYNSDNSGTFRITVEGITDTGIPVLKTVSYLVE